MEKLVRSAEPVSYYERLISAYEYLRASIKTPVRIGIILGSGLGGVLEELLEKNTIPYREIPGFPVTTSRGHRGELVAGKISQKNVIVFNGRFHYYQGYSLQDVTLIVRVAAQLGVESFIITNAAGGIKRRFRPGDIMLIRDHINLMGSNPLIGLDTETFGELFVDMSSPYDASLLKGVKEVARKNPAIGKLREGVYIAVSGPSYETRSEIAFFRKIGADAVGMSTVPEVIVCAQLGIRVVGLSVISNLATGLKRGRLSHSEVLSITGSSSRRLSILIKDIVEHVL
ncbi:MAG: purine-nucleoside phosphorylase [Spirochaetota bacterium]